MRTGVEHQSCCLTCPQVRRFFSLGLFLHDKEYKIILIICSCVHLKIGFTIHATILLCSFVQSVRASVR